MGAWSLICKLCVVFDTCICMSVPQAMSELQQSRREVIVAATSLAEVLFDKHRTNLEGKTGECC